MECLITPPACGWWACVLRRMLYFTHGRDSAYSHTFPLSVDPPTSRGGAWHPHGQSLYGEYNRFASADTVWNARRSAQYVRFIIAAATSGQSRETDNYVPTGRALPAAAACETMYSHTRLGACRVPGPRDSWAIH